MASLPIEINFGAQKPGVPHSRAYEVVVRPSNSTTFNDSNNNVVAFEIPCGGKPNVYMDPQGCYLQFSVQNNHAANAAVVDFSAYSFFTRALTTCAGNTIDDITDFGVLSNMLLSYTQSEDSRNTTLNVMCGTAETATGSRDGVSIAVGAKRSFNLPLPGAIFLGSDKVIPVGKIRNDIRVEYTIAPFTSAIVAAATTLAISDITLRLRYVEIAPEAQQAIDSMTGGNYTWHANSWRSYTNSIPAAVSGLYSLTIPARFASLQSLISVMRLSGDITRNASNSYSGFTFSKVSQYQYKVGADVVNPTPVDTLVGTGNAYAQALQCFHAMSRIDNCSCVNSASFYTTTDAANGATGGGVLAVELSAFAGRANSIQSGVNTLNMNSQLDLYFSSATAAAGNLTVTSFANFDVLLSIRDGLLYANQ